MLTYLIAQATGDDIFGTIEAPPGVVDYNKGGTFGLTLFISNLLRVATLLAGLWILLNFILAGYNLISAGGDSGAYSKVSQRLTMSVVGLIVIVAAYIIIGIISWIFFGSPGYLLEPVIKGPTDI